ncbi:hypothetical protein UCDDA912_g01514 [Diaporthe ampelina]|uniref:Uncharacterized protein n=1 Tax=Diaporthe ampelina TaxID=1214573 RepID=A0A0G2FWF1_9PEZI|nr:hypothetical protein UCDDA912_g01514 [Diaporthe ampelina]
MQFTNIILVLASAASLAMAAPQGVISRQSPTERVTSILRDARNSAMEQIETGGGRGRTLSEANCSAACSQCQTGAVTAAVGEIALCGSIALATEVATAGLATVLEVSGFIGCETTIIGELNKSEAECQSLT